MRVAWIIAPCSQDSIDSSEASVSYQAKLYTISRLGSDLTDYNTSQTPLDLFPT